MDGSLSSGVKVFGLGGSSNSGGVDIWVSLLARGNLIYGGTFNSGSEDIRVAILTRG